MSERGTMQYKERGTMQYKRWRITSDGTMRGTRVFDSEGRDVTAGIKGVVITVDGSRPFVNVTLTLERVELDVVPFDTRVDGLSSAPS